MSVIVETPTGSVTVPLPVDIDVDEHGNLHLIHDTNTVAGLFAPGSWNSVLPQADQ